MNRSCQLKLLAVAVLVSSAGGVIASPRASAQTAAATQPDSLPLRHRPERNVLTIDAGSLRSIAVGPQFTYVGGQRFILGASADAEQHFFVAADSSRTVQRMYWIQLEELLPSRAGGYNYQADSVRTIHGLDLRVNVRAYTTPPDAVSDRGRAFALVQSRGYTVPEGATRVRLIYLPGSAARREVMIIYVEAPSAATSDTATAREALTARALGGLTLSLIAPAPSRGRSPAHRR